MSRSNPQENGLPNPAVRWFEWNGENGVVRYYDKENKQNVDLGSDFTFLLLDQLGSVRGWHDASDSGIYSNEVKDTKTGVMVVKSFKGGTLAEGVYKDIKDRVNTLGGRFVTNCYIAFKLHSDTLKIGSLRFKGAALGAWMEFCKANRADLYKKAIRIHGTTEGKKGRITFYTPVIKTVDITPETDQQATALDVELQEFLKGYFRRTTNAQVETSARHVSDEEVAGVTYDDDPATPPPPPLDDDSIPF